MQKDNNTKPDKLNLWTGSASSQQGLNDGADHGRVSVLRAPRRLSERAILSLFREWLLQEYVPAYCRSLAATRIFRRCYWVDALGVDSRAQLVAPPTDAQASQNGRGRKQKNTIPAALAPILALSQQLAQESKAIALYGLLLEAGSSRKKESQPAQNGTANTDQVIPKESAILVGSWLENSSVLLKQIEQSPAIFILNPLGQTIFSYDDLAPLYQRTIPTELCLLLSHKQIEQRLQSAHKSTVQAAELTALLRTTRWKTLPTDIAVRDQSIIGFIELLIASQQRHFLLPVQPITLPIAIGPATIEASPYTLLFATRRSDSLNSINNALCLYRRRTEEQSYYGVLGEDWFLSQQRQRLESELSQLSQEILQQGQSQRIRRWPDLRQQQLLSHFGQFTLQDYNTIIQQLIRTNKVRCTWRHQLSTPLEECIPGPDDTLIWG